MIKCAHLAVAALALTALAATVSADDIVVKAPAGGETVTLTEGEETSVTNAELKELLKGALENAGTCNILVGAKGEVSVDVGSGEPMPLNASAIVSMDKNEGAVYANLYHSVNIFGEENEGTQGAYMWKDGDTWFTAMESEDGWAVTSSKEYADPVEELAKGIDSLDEETLSVLTPADHFYEANGKTYYVFTAEKDALLGTASNIEAAAGYTEMADSVIGDNPLQVLLAVDSETGFPYFFSIDASGAAGVLPGEILGSETDLSFTADNLYVSAFFSEDAALVDIPEDVLKAEVSDIGIQLNDALASLLGGVS